MKITIAERKIIDEICTAIQSDCLKKWEVNELSRQYHISAFKLNTGIKIVHGCSFKQYILEVQMHQAKEKIKKGSSIYDLVIEFGYSSSYNFTRAFRKVFPKPPTAYIPIKNR